MAHIQLAQQLTQHLTKLITVTDGRKIGFIIASVTIPIHTVKTLCVKCLLGFAPHMAKHIGPFFSEVNNHLAVDAHTVLFTGSGIDLGDASVCVQEDALLVLIPAQASAACVQGHQHFSFFCTEVGGPEIHTALESCEVV